MLLLTTRLVLMLSTPAVKYSVHRDRVKLLELLNANLHIVLIAFCWRREGCNILHQSAAWFTAYSVITAVQLMLSRSVDPAGTGGLNPRKYVGGVRVCSLENVKFFHSKLLLDSSAIFTSSRTKDLCQKLEGKTNFSRRPTGCQDPGLLSVWKSLT